MRYIAVVLILGMLVPSCTKPKDLEYVDVQNIRMVRWGLSESIIGVDVRLYNPNKQRVQLKDANAKLYANSAYLGDAYTDSTLQVPSRDTFAIPLLVKLQTASALTKAMQLLSDSVVAIKVEGNVKMGKAGVFVNYPIQYDRVQKVSDLNINL